MQMGEGWLKTWICLSLLFAWASSARPRFDVSTDMGMVLVPADAEPDTAIFRLRATDQDADFPLVFEIIATTSPVVRVENLPCTLYNKVCQANVILTRRLVAGRLHDFVVRVRDSKGDVNSMQATISVTNATTPRDKIFPHVPSLIMVPEDTKPEKELDYLLVESNPWSGKPVYIELWQPKELFKIRQRQMGSQTKGIITLIGELDFETQSMYTLTMYATDPYTEPGKDTRNIAGLHVVVIVQDVQDVPPVFTLAPPLTKINNTVKPGDVILRVHAEDGDKGVPREVTYGLISEGNPFTPFFNVSETTGEIILARPLEELTKITHVGAPIVLKIVAEEIRTMRDEPPAQATVVELGLLLGEPGNSPPYFENDNYVAWMDENAEPGTIVVFTDAYSTRVRDEDIGKAGVFALKLENNNGTFEISPAVAERTANFVITVRDNTLIDYEKFRSLRFRIIAQEVGPATNLSASVAVTIFLRDINDNPPIFDIPVYEVTLSENANAGTRVVQVHATDMDADHFGRIQYTKIIGTGSDAFEMNPDTGLITVSMGSVLDREQTPRLELTVEARDEEGRGQNRGIATLIVNILDVNDNLPIFEKGIYEFLLNSELTNFTMPAVIKAVDADAEPPNNEVRYEIIHGNYENKFILNEKTGELILREPINKARKVRQSQQTLNLRKQFRVANSEIFSNETNTTDIADTTSEVTSQNITDPITNSTINPLNITDLLSHDNTSTFRDFHLLNNLTETDVDSKNQSRRRRAEDTPLFILTARAYDLGVPHLSSIAQIRIMRPMSAFARIVMFVMPGENPDPKKTAETLATITGSRVIIQEIKPYVSQIESGSGSDLGKRSVVVAKVEQNGPGTLVDVEKIRESLAANGFGILSGMDGVANESPASPGVADDPSISNSEKTNVKNITIVNSSSEEVTVYKAENKLLTWLLVLFGLALLAAIITLIICCICPSCPFYMEPRKRRIHSSETLIIRSDGRPKRHLHRKPIKVIDGYHTERKEAWSADPARQHWQFDRRNTKNGGIASLPGDVVPGHQNPEIQRLRRVASLRQDGNRLEPGVFGEHVIHPPRIIPMPMADDPMYMEDVETTQNQHYDQAELDSLRRHEMERGSDQGRQEPMREQHFYREGNAEVLRLVTRGEIEDRKGYPDGTKDLYHANGKDILLQRFIEDQKLRRSQDLRGSFHESLHEADVDRSMESHRRINGPAEIIIIPERLEVQRQPSYDKRQHQQEQMMNADVQRVIIERNYKSKDFKDEGGDEYVGRSQTNLRTSMRDVGIAAGDLEDTSGRSYGIHDAELVRQNALLTRLLLEKEARGLSVPMADTSSFLETQSLPGQVAIATQTDRTAATQTEFFARSRSDNEESEEDPRMRRKSKLKGRLDTREDFKKMKTIWVRTPIPEESRAQSGSKKATPTRTKIEVLESRKVSISPDVLKEISNSLKSGESGGNEEEDEDEEGDEILKESEAKPDKVQKMHKGVTKSVGTSKKKVKDTKADDDSTTPSPEMKDKKTAMKAKIRKKPEKPPRKKLEKSIESEKGHFMEPSFRVLEREISSFQQKIRQFGDKKLKMLKKDDSKKEKESEDDDGTTYDVSKKCEVTVTKTKKKETSPTKISVEQKKTSEEESNTKEKKNITRQQQQNVSSSDFEDSDKSKRQPSNFSERTTQCETSKTQTRSQSKLRRQTNLENSDTTKSSSEKIEKSDDSENKTNKSKDSSSSAETKIDYTSSSSRDFDKRPKQMESERTQKSQTQEKKTLQSQRVTKVRPSRIVDIKRKVTSLKSKSVEEPVKRTAKKDEKVDNKAKSLTSDDSKLTSPSKSRESVYYKKSATSEEEKSKSSMKESRSIDFDKLMKDVRGVVEKEISSLTKAAKDALNMNKSESTDSDKKQEKQVSAKSKELKKSQSIIDLKSQGQSVSTSKPGMDNTKSVEKEKISKSTEAKERREKLKEQKSKSRSTESTTSTKVKSDDAISFIVIENKKSISEMTEQSKMSQEAIESTKLEKVEHDNIEDSNKENSKENLHSSDSDGIVLDTKKISEQIDKTAKTVSDKMEQVTKDTSDVIDDTLKTVSEKVDESKQSVSNKISEIKKDVSDDVEQVKETLSDEIDKTEKTVSDEIDITGKIVSETIHNTIKDTSNKIDETKNNVSDGINKVDETVSDTVKETKEVVSDKIQKTAETISDGINKVDETVSDTVKETKEVVSDKIQKTAETVSDGIDEKSKIITDEIDETKSSISNGIKGAMKTVSEKMDKGMKSVSDKIVDAKNFISDKVDEFIKDTSAAAEESSKTVTDDIDESKKTVSDGVDEASKMISDKIEDTNVVISNTVDEANTNITNAMSETEKDISDKIDEKKYALSNTIDESIAKADEISKIDSTEQSSLENVSKISSTEIIEPGVTVSSNIDESKEKTIKEIEHGDTTDDSLKFMSTSLPTEPKNTDDEKTTEPHSETNEAQTDEEPISTIDSNKVIEMTRELLEIEKMNGDSVMQQAQTSTKESITTPSSSPKENDTTTEITEMKQMEEQLNKADSSFSTDANKDKDKPLEELTQLKQTKEAEMQETDKIVEASQAQSQTTSNKGDETKPKTPGSPIKLLKPLLTVTEATTGNEDSDSDDTSSASDISNKTALRTRPYSTPRHSISSDSGGKAEEIPAKSNGKPPRQRWNSEKSRDPLLGVDTVKEFSKAVFPQKIEVPLIDKPKVSAVGAVDSSKVSAGESQDDLDDAVSTSSKSTMQTNVKASEVPNTKTRTDPPPRTRPVVVAMRKKEHIRADHFSRHTETRKTSPRRDKSEVKSESDKKTHPTEDSSRTSKPTTITTSEQRKVEIRSKHLKLHVSHHYRQPKNEAADSSPVKISGKIVEKSPVREKSEDSHGTIAGESKRVIDYGKDPEIAKARSRYMTWYQQKRSEMEKKRREKKEAEEEQQKPKWLRKAAAAGKSRKAKSAEDGDKNADDAKSSRSRERAKSSSDATNAAQSTTPRATHINRLRIRPLINVESEQLKAIVRQGRKLRRKEGAKEEDPPVQIFAPDKPPPPPRPSSEERIAGVLQIEPRHYLTQHSEYKYEKEIPAMPFYLHPPPPVPHPSPEHFQDDSSDSRRLDDDLDSGIAVSLQGGTRLRNQQLLEKKSVFDIAYNEASPTQLRSDSSTPPS